MTTCPIYRPNTAFCKFYPNVAKGTDPVEYTLGLPRCIVTRVHNAVSPNNGTATIRIILGNAITDETRIPVYSNFTGSSSTINEFRESLRGSFVKIYTYVSDGTSTQTITTDQGIFLQPIPIDTPITDPDAGAPDETKLIMVGKIFSVDWDSGNQSTELILSVIDFGGVMSANKFEVLPTSWSDSVVNQIPQECLPDFNMLISNNMLPNQNISNVDWTYNLPDYTNAMNTAAFNGEDPQNDASLGARTLWTNLDIADLLFAYCNQWFNVLLTGINCQLVFNDMTGNLDNCFETHSSRGNLWDIMNSICSRKKSLILWWTYDDSGDVTQCILNCGFMSDTAYNGFLPLTLLNYTAANSFPIGFTDKPVIKCMSNDDFAYIRVKTLPPSLVYTYQLDAQFYEGYSTTFTPDDAQILQGGVNSIYFSRFVFDLLEFNKISTTGILSSGFATESWTAANCTAGITFETTQIDPASPITPVLKVIDYTANSALAPYAQTIKIAPNIPISSTNAGDTSNIHSPILIFKSYGPDSADNIEKINVRVSMKELMNTISFNPDADNFDIFRTSTDRQSYYITCCLEETPPLWIQFTKDVNNQEASILSITHNIRPTIIMNNTITGIDQFGKPIMVTNSSTEICTLLANGTELTTQKLYDDMNRIAQFFLKPKNKTSFSISFIDPRDLLGNYMQTLDVPAPTTSNPPVSSYQTIDINTVVTDVIWDFERQTTSYITDFKTYTTGT